MTTPAGSPATPCTSGALPPLAAGAANAVISLSVTQLWLAMVAEPNEGVRSSATTA